MRIAPVGTESANMDSTREFEACVIVEALFSSSSDLDCSLALMGRGIVFSNHGESRHLMASYLN